MNWTILAPFGAYLLVVMVVGIYGYKVLATTQASGFSEEFYVGSRSLGPWVLAMTFAASLGSAGSFLGTPALAYRDGFVWLIIAALQTGSIFVGLGLLGKRLAIVGRKLKAYTVPQVLEARFPSAFVRYYIPLIIAVFLTIYMAPQFIGGARVLEAMAGVPYTAGVLVVGVITVVYTFLGGFRAASLTDLIQGIFMAMGSILLLVFVLRAAGGLTPIVDELQGVSPSLITPNAGGTLGILFTFSTGWLLLGIALLSLPHATVRGLAFRNSQALHKAMIIGTVAAATFTSVIWFVGVSGHYIVGDIDTPDQVIPLVAIELFNPLVAGIVLAVPFAAIMSTVDSMLLVVASSLVEDLYSKARGDNVTDSAKRLVNRGATIVVGVLVVLIALSPPEFLQSLVFFAVGGLASSLLIPILLGLYWPRANTPGAIASTIGGGISYLLFERVFPPITSADAIMWSLPISLALMVVVSLMSAKPDRVVLQKFWGKQSADDSAQKA